MKLDEHSASAWNQRRRTRTMAPSMTRRHGAQLRVGPSRNGSIRTDYTVAFARRLQF